jgi:aminopeptidase N
VLEVVATNADQAAWDGFHAMAKGAKTEIERQEFYDLLAVAADGALARQALNLALSGEPPPTVGPDMVTSAADYHPQMAADFAIAHWDALRAFIEPASQARFVPLLLSRGRDLRMIQTLDDFAARYLPANARQELRKAEAKIRYLADVRTRRLPEVDAWIAERGSTSRP